MPDLAPAETPDQQLQRLIAMYSRPPANPPGAAAAGAPTGAVTPPGVSSPVAMPNSAPPVGPAAPLGMPGSPYKASPDATALPARAIPPAGEPPITQPLAPTRQTEDEANLRRIRSSGSGVEQYRTGKDIYGNPIPGKSAHPILGTIARIGDAALGSMFPRVAMNLPGTTLHHNVVEGQAAGRVAGDVGQAEKEAQTGEIGAKTAHEQAETGAVPSQIAKTQAETEAAENKPGETWKAVTGMVGPNGTVLQESNLGNMRWAPGISGAGPVKTAAEKPDQPEQQFVDEYQKSHPGATIGQAQRAFKQNETVSEPGNYQPVNDGQGNTVGWVDPKAKHFVGVNEVRNLGGATPNGVIPAKPTMQMRNVAAQATLVHSEMPNVIAEIQGMKAELGPLEGRWNEFMQGKVGMDNPKFAGLRTDLLMMSSAVALMHARGRLPENLREEFDNAINAPKQSADNLVSVLQHIDKWTADNMRTMGGEPGNAGTAQQGGNMVRARDPQGKLHEAPAGTALPAGWKAE